MRFRTLAAAAVTAAAQLTPTTAAHAAPPSCMTFNVSSPWIAHDTTGQWVRGGAAYESWCTDQYVLVLRLQSRFCEFPFTCFWATLDDSTKARYMFGGGRAMWEYTDAACREGTHQYRTEYAIYNSAGVLVDQGLSSDPHLTCSDPVPPPPSIDDCPKYADQLCYLVDPPD